MKRGSDLSGAFILGNNTMERYKDKDSPLEATRPSAWLGGDPHLTLAYQESKM